MDLEQIKDNIKRISLSKPELTAFNYGEEFVLDDTNTRQPQAFLEIPYNLNYDLGTNQKTVQFALLVLYPSAGVDSVQYDHKAISKAEQIGDMIIKDIQALKPQGLIVESVNGLSVRNISDSDLAGFRFDITARTIRVC